MELTPNLPSPPDALTSAERRWWPLTDGLLLVAAVVFAVFVPANRDVSWFALVPLMGMVLAVQVRVPLLAGRTIIAVQVFFVPLAFALPANLLILAVLTVNVVDVAVQLARGAGVSRHTLMFVGDAMYSVCPAVVLSTTSGEFHWGDWPLYTLAFAGQFAVDGAFSQVRLRLANVPTEPWRMIASTTRVDAALTPIGLLAASAQDTAPVGSSAALLSLLLLMRSLAFERRARIQTSLDAMHDQLTGAANRRLLLLGLHAAIAQAGRDGQQRALMVLDLDGFKAVNDRHGHATGDRVLREVAKRTGAVLRGADILARFGGDEFAVLCGDPQTPETAQAVAGRLRAALDDSHLGPGDCPVSASIGLVLFGGDATTPEEVIALADQRMYDDKRARQAAAV